MCLYSFVMDEWCLSLSVLFILLQFVDHGFASLSGARVVRIATHPDFQKVRLACLVHTHIYVHTHVRM